MVRSLAVPGVSIPVIDDLQEFLRLPLRLERIDPARNMARYYTLSIEMTLFDDVACLRGFGRIGTPRGRIMIGLFESRAAAEAELHRLLRQKQARGYKLAGR